MPSYTHLRRAQPVLVAHYLLAHVAALRRDHARSTRPATRPTRCRSAPARSPAPATRSTSRRWRADLGFSRVVANSIDASSDRDFVASFLYACALAMVHLSRLAEDLILFTGEEFGFFELADAVATGSSLMPQKKNPDPLELVRGKSGRVIGRLTGWLTTMKGLPSGYNKDLQEDKEAVFDAEDTLARCSDDDRRPSSPACRSTPSARGSGVRACCWPPTSPITWWRGGCRSAGARGRRRDRPTPRAEGRELRRR